MPSAVLLDLDDTILNDSGSVDESWRHACASHADRLAPLDAAVVVDAIRKTRSGSGTIPIAIVRGAFSSTPRAAKW